MLRITCKAHQHATCKQDWESDVPGYEEAISEIEAHLSYFRRFPHWLKICNIGEAEYIYNDGVPSVLREMLEDGPVWKLCTDNDVLYYSDNEEDIEQLARAIVEAYSGDYRVEIEEID